MRPRWRSWNWSRVLGLELAGVTVWYPPRPPVLADVNLAVPSGQCVAVLGANGSGKSLLLKLVAGALPPSRGTVRVGPGSARALPGGTVAWVSSDVDGGLVGATVRDHVNFYRPPPGRVATACARFGLGSLMDREVDTLSPGEKQRVALAGWFASGAAVWLLDEPTGPLDPEAARDVRQLIRELATDGATILLATHEAAEVALAHRVLVLEAGQVVFDGTPEALVACEPHCWAIPRSTVADTGRALRRHRGGDSAPVTFDPTGLVAWVAHAWR